MSPLADTFSVVLLVVGVGLPLAIWCIAALAVISKPGEPPRDERYDQICQVLADAREEKEAIVKREIEFVHYADEQIGETLKRITGG